MEKEPTQLVGRDGSPVRMSMRDRDASPRRMYQAKKIVAPETFETPYVVAQRYDLVIPEKTV